MEQDKLTHEWDLISKAIDIDFDEIEKGATGLNRYINDPTYRPKVKAVQRGGKTYFGTVYEKANHEDLKQNEKMQRKLENQDKLHGKKVKVNFRDKQGKHHESKNASIEAHDDKHFHVKLNEDIKHKDGRVAHKAGKVVKVPKLGQSWLEGKGHNRVSEHDDSDEKSKDDKKHEKLVAKDRQEVKKEDKKEKTDSKSEK
jgi:hypothetical protein